MCDPIAKLHLNVFFAVDLCFLLLYCIIVFYRLLSAEYLN